MQSKQRSSFRNGSPRRAAERGTRIRPFAFLAANMGLLAVAGLLIAGGTPLPTQAAPQSDAKTKPAGNLNVNTNGNTDGSANDASNSAAKPIHKDGRPAHLDMQIRDDFFVGFTGDEARLAHGMKICEQMMAKYPNFAEAMVWHGSGLVFQSAKLFAKGDSKQGMTVWQKGLDEMDAAVKLEPNNVSVLIPRAATLIPSARFINYKPLADGLWAHAVSDYEKTYAAQKSDFDKFDAHTKGELLFGLAEANARLGREEKARTYLKQIQQTCKGTDYATEAQSWLDRKTLATGLPSRNCIGCHVK